MPTHHKPIKNHAPMDYAEDLKDISDACDDFSKDFLALFERRNLRPLEFDDLAALIEQVKRRLIRFALDCNALPRRTPRQLIATVKAIAQNPYAYREEVGSYDPEASARVYGKIASRSAEYAARLEQFEWGTGPAPPLQDISEAASAVLLDLEHDARAYEKGGGQKLVLQHELTRDLAKIFEGFGGWVARNTRFDPDLRGNYDEVGPFHDFLKIVLPVARVFARRSGFEMDSIRYLVAELLESRAKDRK